jgi:hypothetical protein
MCDVFDDYQVILAIGERRNMTVHKDAKAIDRSTGYVYKATQRFKAAHEVLRNFKLYCIARTPWSPTVTVINSVTN